MRAVHVCTDVTAVDLTPELLELARAKPGADAIRFDHGDAQALPYADGSFDVVASNFGVIFAADRDAGARELARVCRRGGRLGLTAWYRRPALDAVWNRLGRPPSVDFYAWADRDEQERLLGAAFDLERHERVWHLEGESGEAVYEFWSRTAPASKAFLESLDDETRAEARAALVEYWEGFRRGDRISEPRPYVLVLGRRR